MGIKRFAAGVLRVLALFFVILTGWACFNTIGDLLDRESPIHALSVMGWIVVLLLSAVWICGLFSVAFGLGWLAERLSPTKPRKLPTPNDGV